MRILVIEDDPVYRAFLVRILTAAGHQVDSEENAQRLSRSLASGHLPGAPAPDVIVLDHQLPAVSGVMSLELLARHPRACGIPVILHSALDRVALSESARGHPRLRVVPKTGHASAVLAALRDVTDVQQ